MLYYLCPLGHAPSLSESQFHHLYGELTFVDHFDQWFLHPVLQEDSPRGGLFNAYSWAVAQTFTKLLR